MQPPLAAVPPRSPLRGGPVTPLVERPGGQLFRDIASQLANELVNQLTEEHNREVNAMYEEVLMLRGELQRVGELMQAYLAREKQLHEMMDMLNNTYAEATAHFHHTHSQFLEHAKNTSGQLDRRSHLADASRDTARELARIQAILAQPVTPPPEAPVHLHHHEPVSPVRVHIAGTPLPGGGTVLPGNLGTPAASPARMSSSPWQRPPLHQTVV